MSFATTLRSSSVLRDFLSGNPPGGYQSVVSELTDQQLLLDYARNHSESAFAGLVGRHVDLVYSAALRLVMDPHLAEDVTQSVFLAVARNAGKLHDCAVLSAWLHRTTRNQAAVVVRGEVRRRTREKEAAIMNSSSGETDSVWDQLAPHLDDALARLPAADRDALLLRFFERKTAREIGERLGVSEEATQKRLTRALDRLREVFAARGVAVTVASLAAAISSQAVQAAPTALAASVCAAAFSTVTAGSTLGLIQLMISTHIKTGLVTLATAGLATTVVLQHRTNGKLRAELSELNSQTSPPAIVREVPTVDHAAIEELARLRAQQSELHRLRGEVGMLREQVRQQAATQVAPAEPEPRPAPPADFIPSEDWTDVGTATPQAAFQSFLATLKTDDAERIASTVHWDIQWRKEVTDEDITLVEKSMQDYLEMLQRASRKISAFNLQPVADDAAERTRVFFQTQTTDGEMVDSHFEMIRVDGQWKPVLGMRWLDESGAGGLATTPVFGPKIDLEP